MRNGRGLGWVFDRRSGRRGRLFRLWHGGSALFAEGVAGSELRSAFRTKMDVTHG